jgi:cytoskeletal protein RodZ
MARKNNLAALAALAGLAYVNREKLGFGPAVDLSETKDSNPDRGAGYVATATREAPRRKIEDYQAKAPDDTDKKSNAKSVDNAENPSNNPKPSNNPAKPVVKRQDRTTMYGTKSGVMGGATLPYASAASTSSAKTSASPMKDTVRSKADAQKLIDYHKEAGKTGSNVEYKTEPNGATTATAVKKPKTVTAVPLSDINREADKSQGPFYRGKQNDIFDREIDAMGNKKGGAIKKMASGGMAASRRGDGIAQRGKTRGKMC